MHLPENCFGRQEDSSGSGPPIRSPQKQQRRWRRSRARQQQPSLSNGQRRRGTPLHGQGPEQQQQQHRGQDAKMICRIRAKVLGKQNDYGKLDLKGNLLCEDYFFDLQANVNEWLKFNKNLYLLNFWNQQKMKLISRILIWREPFSFTDFPKRQ